MSITATAPVLSQAPTFPKHRQASYTLPDGTVRVINAQRVFGHVRLTDEPECPVKGTRSYVIERCVESDPVADGTSAAAHLNSIIADYLEQALRLGRCPLERESLLTDAVPTRMLAPKAQRPSPFEVMRQYRVESWAAAIAARAAERRAAEALAAAAAAAEAEAEAQTQAQAVAA